MTKPETKLSYYERKEQARQLTKKLFAQGMDDRQIARIIDEEFLISQRQTLKYIEEFLKGESTDD
jgi:hypothetical protein